MSASLTYYVVVFTGINFSCIPELEYVATDARKIDDVSMDESNEELGLELREQLVDKLDIEKICWDILPDKNPKINHLTIMEQVKMDINKE